MSKTGVNASPIFSFLLALFLLVALPSGMAIAQQVPEIATSPDFSAAERIWLAGRSELVLGVDPDWAPFEFIDESGAYQGMAAAYISLVEQMTGLPVRVQNNPTWQDVITSAKVGSLDMLPAAMASAQRREYLEFTRPHITYPMVIVTTRDAPFLSQLDDLAGQAVAVVDSYVTEDLLREKHPELALLEAPDLSTALTMVATGEAVAMVDNMASVTHAITRLGLSNLRISGVTPYEFQLSIAVPKGRSELLGILQKSLDAITPEQHAAIREEWVSAKLTPSVDMTRIVWVLALFTTGLIGVLLWNHRLQNEVRRRKLTEKRLAESEKRFRVLFEDSQAVELIIDPESGEIVAANRAAVRFYGYDQHTLLHMNIAAINTLSEEEIRIEMQLAQRESRDHLFFRHRLASDEIRDVEVHSGPVEWENRTLLFSIIHDVTEEMRLKRELSVQTEQLTYQASHDALTGVLNRREFEHRLALLLGRSEDHTKHALMYLDLDQFKTVNDACGHVAGDELLVQVTHIIAAQLRRTDTLARLGGDEFGVQIEQCTEQEAVHIADKIRCAVGEFQFAWEDRLFRVGVSIGIVMVDSGLAHLGNLLKYADQACYAAKEGGRNKVHVYHDDDDYVLTRQGEVDWVQKIHKALDEHRLTLFLQPIRSTDPNEQRTSYEVLLRLMEEDGEIVLPGSFLPAAERFGLMRRIDRWVVANTLSRLSENAQVVDTLDYVSINLSGQSLSDTETLEFIVAAVTEHRSLAYRLCFEITETEAIANLGKAAQFMERLHAKGVRFALDDFGSGLSSFGYLKSLNVDYLKIDGMFIRGIVDNPVDKVMVKSIREVAAAMGKRTVAEFVEDEATHQLLCELEIDAVQGYAIGRPVPMEVVHGASSVRSIA